MKETGLMDKIIKILEQNGIEYNTGIIVDGYYYEIKNPFQEKNVINFKWKSASLGKLLEKLEKRGIVVVEKYVGMNCALYDIEGTNNQMLVTFAINSHIQLPNFILQNFRTEDHLYYINTELSKIMRSSAKKYNTSFGFYPISFEKYLSLNYEQEISKIIETVKSLLEGRVQIIVLENLTEIMNKIFLMALVRNPEFVKRVNEESVAAKVIGGGFNAEYLMHIGEKMENNFIKNYTPVLLVNKTNTGFITVKSLISSLKIHRGCEGMIVLLHPKFAIQLFTNEDYERMMKEDGNPSYYVMDDEKTVLSMNKQIYNYAKYKKEDVIGIKVDLERLLN